MSHHTTTPLQDLSTGFGGLVILALFIGVPIGILYLIQGGNMADTTILCSDGIKYHLKRRW